MKNYLDILILSLCTLTLVLSSCNQKNMLVHNLQCEYLDDPLSIDNPAPLLGWQLQSEERGKSQTAYRILVSGSPSSLKEGEGDFWDSGIIKSSQSVQIPYNGKSLTSRQQVYWKVMVWDEKGQETNWSKPATWAMGLLQPSDWSARWISNLEDPHPDSVITYPAPYFRNEFPVDKPVRQAKVYVCGLGFYEMYLNGNRVGNQVLAPAVTNYDERVIENILYQYDDQSTQRVLYNTFDVTSLLQKGQNTIGALLGNGWYNQRDRTVEGCLWYDTPRMILQLEIEYADGSRQTVATDKTWKTSTGPLVHDAIFTGEVYDARMELDGWNENEYNDAAWCQALEVRAPTGALQPQLAPFDKIVRTIQPVFEGKENDSTYLYTLPEMISGWAELTVEGKSGSRIELQFVSEEADDYGQSDVYILKGGGPEKWEPRFTWHAFRSVKAISKDVKMGTESLTIKVVNTDPAKNGNFTCSNDLFNKVNEAYVRTQDANFHGSISSDCPHRERLAYTGDAQVVVESSLLTYDMTQFYRKWFNDMEDARNKNTGYVPHTAPFAGGGGGPAWGSAYVIMPWAYYCYYGDKTLLEQHYKGMKQWVEYLETRTDERGIVVREEPNGWCLGDWCTPENVQIPESLVNTAYYYHSANLMSKVAAVLGKEADVACFTQLSGRIQENFNKVFFNPVTSHYWEGRQGADVFALAFGIVPDENKQAVFNALLDQLKTLDYHFDTGILATPLLLTVLTENGRTDLAYQIMNQRSEPGYGYLLDQRYSCLWERWDGKASRCHPMFGSVVAWFYNTLAGIRFDESEAGMKHINIMPDPVEDMEYCTGSYQSLYGLVRSEWQINKQKAFNLTVEIPANTTATVYLPNKGDNPVTESGVSVEKVEGIRLTGNKEGKSVIEITSGIYSFAVKENPE